MYQAQIRGTVYSVDPIFSPRGYARAVFADETAVTYSVDEKNNRALNFTVRRNQTVDGNTTLNTIQEGLLRGDDRNVNWTVTIVRA